MNTPPILLKATLVFLLNKTSSSRLFLIISETIETGRSIGLVILIINLKANLIINNIRLLLYIYLLNVKENINMNNYTIKIKYYLKLLG